MTAYDPTLAGISREWKAALSDEEWVRLASAELRNVGAEEYFAKMIDIVRAKLGGKQKIYPPNKNDICSCGSGKKFGRCCATLFEAGDPEECRTTGHVWNAWKKIEWSGAYTRTCGKCNGFDSAYEPCQLTIKGDIKVLSVGCASCKVAILDMDVIYETVHAYFKTHGCAACGGPFETKQIVVGHAKTPTGCILGVTEVDLGLDDFVDINSEAMRDSAGIHQACFDKLLPEWKNVCENNRNDPH